MGCLRLWIQCVVNISAAFNQYRFSEDWKVRKPLDPSGGPRDRDIDECPLGFDG
jgi:hypothetical protein